MHGGKYETSCILFERPELVHMDKTKIIIPEIPEDWDQSFFDLKSIKEISELGHFGDPTQATQEFGKKIFDII